MAGLMTVTGDAQQGNSLEAPEETKLQAGTTFR
jgi:hypothetical protein